MKIIEMDKGVTFKAQLEAAIAPVILINKFNIAPEDVDAFLKAWTDDSVYFKEQPGYISTQLHRGIAGSGVFINYAVWETTEEFARAFNNPTFTNKLNAYPASTEMSPQLFQKFAVPQICVS